MLYGTSSRLESPRIAGGLAFSQAASCVFPDRDAATLRRALLAEYGRITEIVATEHEYRRGYLATLSRAFWFRDGGR